MATTISLDSGNNSFFIKDGFLGNASGSTAVNIKGATIDGLAGKDSVDTTKGSYSFPDSNFKLTVDGTGVITLTTSSGAATFRNFEQIKYTNLVVAVGTPGGDALAGTAAADVVLGVAGSDTLDGGAGNDSMYGGAGNDTYIVDSTSDQVIESNSSVHFDTATRTTASVDAGGIDTVQSSVSFTLGSGSFLENLTLTGTAASGTGNELDNLITGNASANLLIGGAGNDTLDGGASVDTLIGGAGNDTYVVDSGDVVQESTVAGGTIDAGGIDTVRSTVDVTLGAFVENLVLEVGAVSGTGNTLANDIRGNAVANTLDGGAGNDTLTGGAGNDTYIVDSGDVVQESTDAGGTVDAGGIDSVQSAVNFTLGAFLENLTLTGTASNGAGNTLDNLITGNASANLLTSGAGNDTLDGGASVDTLIGGAGNDTYVVGSGDVVQESTDAAGTIDAGGIDTVRSAVDVTLGAFVENLVLDVGAVSGTGNTLANDIRGNAVANTLDGGTGNDTLLGGAGDDTYLVNSSKDVVQESTALNGAVDAGGTDTVRATASFTLGSFIENLALDGTVIINGTGNDLGNRLTGNASANKLFGLAGNDVLSGGAGSDSLDGGLGTDTMRGGAGNDIYVVNTRLDVVDETTDGVTDAGGIDAVRSTVSYTLAQFVENLTLSGAANIAGTGNDKANVITGNAGSNTISGAGGADTIRAGAGNDILTGGLQADSFVFNTALDATLNVDTITDWDAGGIQDKILLDKDIFLSLGQVTVTTALDPTMFVKGTAALDDNDHIIYDQATGALYYDPDGIGSAAQVQFATLNTVTGTHPGAGLTATDFFVVI